MTDSVTVTEQVGAMATVCVVLGDLQAGQSLGCSVTVTMAIIDGDIASMCSSTSSTNSTRHICAVVGQDFVMPSNLNLIFTTGSVNGESGCLNIEILDDPNFERRHSFTVVIDSISPPIITDAAGVGVVNIIEYNNGKQRMQFE